jgi:hypothetical protein
MHIEYSWAFPIFQPTTMLVLLDSILLQWMLLHLKTLPIELIFCRPLGRSKVFEKQLPPNPPSVAMKDQQLRRVNKNTLAQKVYDKATLI